MILCLDVLYRSLAISLILTINLNVQCCWSLRIWQLVALQLLNQAFILVWFLNTVVSMTTLFVIAILLFIIAQRDFEHQFLITVFLIILTLNLVYLHVSGIIRLMILCFISLSKLIFGFILSIAGICLWLLVDITCLFFLKLVLSQVEWVIICHALLRK